MKCFVEFVTTPSVDTPGTTLLLHFDNRRYFFGNVAEGTQRACVERGVGLMSMNDIFLTGKTNWKNQGGLLGLVLTIADATTSANTQLIAETNSRVEELKAKVESYKDAQRPKELKVLESLKDQLMRAEQKRDNNLDAVARKSTLSIHGAPNLAHLLATARRFIFRRGMPFWVTEYGNDFDPKEAKEDGEGRILPSFKDDCIKVWAIPVKPGPDGTRHGERSSRKRSREEFEGNANDDIGSITAATSDSHLKTETEQKQQDQIIRQAVISEMFNSTWRMDALVEVPLRGAPSDAALFVRNPETHKIEKYERPKEGQEVPDITVLVRQPWPASNIEGIPPTTPSEVALSYIVQHHDVRGKFDPKKAQQLGVKPGSDYGTLTRGQSVKAMDGTEVTPDMVLGETQVGRAFGIVELPTAAYIDNLINRPEFVKNPELMKALSAIIWNLGPGIGSDERLVKFMSHMPDVKHIVSSPDYVPNTISFPGSAMGLTRFSSVDPDRYQPPLYSNTEIPQPSLAPRFAPAPTLQTAEFLQPAKRGMKVHMQPKLSLDDSECPEPFDTDKLKVGNKPAKVEKRLGSQWFKTRLDTICQNEVGHDVQIYTLGTGSSLPSRYRNVSATLVRVPGVGNYLLDCGEGTLGQLMRLFPVDEVRTILQDLRMIWISHLHADHHLGTASLIRAWNEVVHGADRPVEPPQNDLAARLRTAREEKRLFVVSGVRMIDWLREYACVENYGFDKIIPLSATSFLQDKANMSFFRYHHLNPDWTPLCSANGDTQTTPIWFQTRTASNQRPHLTPLLQAATGLEELETCLVPHCQDARAVSLTFPSGFKISYSGDCRPSPRFAEMGKDSTVLLHEATFEDDMRGDAMAKKHSTVSEALDVAKKMRARNVILTHFSQRYQCVPGWAGCRSAGASPSRSDSRSRSPQRGASSFQRRATYDVPVDDENEEVMDQNEAAKSSLAKSGDGYDPAAVPVVAAFDLMRLRLGDAAFAEAHLDALMQSYVEQEKEDGAKESEKQQGDEKQSKGKSDKGQKKEKKQKEKK